MENIVNTNTPLVGIEPSAILTFRDEYIDLSDDKQVAKQVAKNTFTIDEFLFNEMKKGNITKDNFEEKKQKILVHTHCYQKALSDPAKTIALLNLPKGTEVEEVKSGCCGMAGSFGFEKEHYNLSMKIGNLNLFPAVKAQPAETIIAAPGTSCRHQIKGGTHKQAKHPVEILLEAVK